MVTHHRFAQVAGRRIFYREAGDPTAPAVVLLHGTPASSHMYRGLIDALSDRYHLIAPDYPGFGESDVPDVGDFSYTFDNLASHIDALLDQLGVTRYAMVVQDYGAPVGWRLALHHPDRITAVITQNGNGYTDGFGEPLAGLLAYGRERSAANAEPLHQFLSRDGVVWQFTVGVPDPSVVSPDAWNNALHATVSTPAKLAAQMELFADYVSNLDVYPRLHQYFRDSQVPLLAVWGANDPIFIAPGAEAFRRDLPNAEVHLLDGGHFLLESALDEAVGLIRPFLAANAA